MDEDINKTAIYLTEVETVAQDVLTMKQQKLEISNSKNKYTESMRALEKSEDIRTILDTGKTLFAFPSKVVIQLLKEDIAKVEDEYNVLHRNIRDNVSELRDLEHQPKIVGVGLKPLTGVEAKAIHKLYGET